MLRATATIRQPATLLLAVAAVAAAGCANVSVDHLIGNRTGEKSAAGADLAKAFDGVWVMRGEEPAPEDAAAFNANEPSDEYAFVKYRGNGRLDVAGVFWEETKFVLDSHTLVVTEADGSLFVHLSNDPPEDRQPGDAPFAGGKYAFALLEFGDNTATAYPPNTDRFATAIDAKELEGRRIKQEYGEEQGFPVVIDDIYLSGDSNALAAFIAKHPRQELFEMESPLRLDRVTSLPVMDAESPPMPETPATPDPPVPLLPPRPAPAPTAEP